MSERLALTLRADRETILVVAVWSGERGAPPPLA